MTRITFGIVWAFLSVFLSSIIISACFIATDRAVGDIILLHQWSQTEQIAIPAILAGIVVISFMLTVYLKVLFRDNYYASERKRVLASQQAWKSECETQINEFLNSKYKITLAFFEQNINFGVNIYVDNRYYHKFTILQPSQTMTSPATYFSKYLIDAYKSYSDSVLATCLAEHVAFVDKEKKWKKPARS